MAADTAAVSPIAPAVTVTSSLLTPAAAVILIHSLG